MLKGEGVELHERPDGRLLGEARRHVIPSSPSRTAWPRRTGTAGSSSTRRIGDKVQLVGDDLFVTNTERLKQGHRAGLPPTRSWSRSTRSVRSPSRSRPSRLAKEAGYACVVSHRSGETEDTTIADLAVARQRRPDQVGRPVPQRPYCQVQPAAAHRGASWTAGRLRRHGRFLQHQALVDLPGARQPPSARARGGGSKARVTAGPAIRVVAGLFSWATGGEWRLCDGLAGALVGVLACVCAGFFRDVAHVTGRLPPRRL